MINLAYGESRRATRLGVPCSADMRRAPRLELAGNSGKLVVPQGEYLCHLLDVSFSGLKLGFFHPLPDCETPLLELPSGDRHRLERVWLAGNQGGFRFFEPVDLARLVGDSGSAVHRAIRINLDHPCRMTCDRQLSRAMLCNLSGTGALLRVEQPFEAGREVQLSSPVVPRTPGHVRWCSAGYVGVAFEEAFPASRLAQLVYHIQAALRVNA